MKIVRQGTPKSGEFEEECQECGCVFTSTTEEWKNHFDGFHEVTYFVECPQEGCDNIVYTKV